MQFCPLPRVYLGASHSHVLFAGFSFVCAEIVLIDHETDGKFFGGTVSILNIEHGFVASFISIFSPNHEFHNLCGAMKS